MIKLLVKLLIVLPLQIFVVLPLKVFAAVLRGIGRILGAPARGLRLGATPMRGAAAIVRLQALVMRAVRAPLRLA